MNYIEVNLLEMPDIYGEDKIQSILSPFICPYNRDVENFIQSKAISFAKQRLAMTYLVFSKEESPLLSSSLSSPIFSSSKYKRLRKADFS